MARCWPISKPMARQRGGHRARWSETAMRKPKQKSGVIGIFAEAAAAGLARAPPRKPPRKTMRIGIGADLSFDSLDSAVAYLRPLLADTTQPTRHRSHLLWATAMRVRDLAGTAATFNALMALAVETDLINQAGGWRGKDVRDTERRHGAEDVAHVIKSALRGFNPFEEEPE
jgi:hypothetical protein